MQQKSSKTPWIVCGVIALLVVCGGAGLLGVLFLVANRGGAEGLVVDVEMPYVSPVGSPFDVAVTLKNEGEKAFTVTSITLPAELLALAEVQQITGDAEDQGDGKYKVSVKLEPGETQVVNFTLAALAAGDISGEVEVAAGGQTLKVDVSTIGAAVVEEPGFDVVFEPTSAPADIPASTGEIAGIPYKAVVQILAMVDMEGEIRPAWSGSGSIVSPDGLILTNAHVVLSDRYYEVQYLVVAMTTAPDALPEPLYVAEIMQVDQALDIAVIRISNDLDGGVIDRSTLNLPTVPFGNDTALQLGDDLTILGYPSIGGSTITLTNGKVSGFTAEEGYGNRAFIKTSATISGGNSGGLAANASGEIIGIPTQLGYGGDDQYVDCRVLADTNRDGVVDEKDSCVPTGGFINALRPLALAKPLIEAAARGEVNIKQGVQEQQGSIPEESGSTILYSDDFSDPSSGWDIDTWDDGAVDYVDGEYHVTVNTPNWLVWSYLGDDYDNIIINADTRVVSATGKGDYGLICRYVDENNFYAFEVSEDGYFIIWKQMDGEMITLYDWETSDAIPSNGKMTINAGCIGNHLIMGVNDALLADITDDSFSTGKVGIIVGTLEETGLTVGYDNFVVIKPE